MVRDSQPQTISLILQGQRGTNDFLVPNPGLVLQFLGRFRNPLIIILLVPSAVSAATGDASEAENLSERARQTPFSGC